MTEPRPTALMSMSFQTSNSGAFRSLHCLIYKVLAPLRSVAEHSLSYHNFSALSSTFFDFFQNLFRAHSALGAASEALLSYHTLANLSSTFFNFFKVFSALVPFARSLAESLVTIAHSLSFVKPFFHFPGNFFISSQKPCVRVRQLA